MTSDGAKCPTFYKGRFRSTLQQDVVFQIKGTPLTFRKLVRVFNNDFSRLNFVPLATLALFVLSLELFFELLKFCRCVDSVCQPQAFVLVLRFTNLIKFFSAERCRRRSISIFWSQYISRFLPIFPPCYRPPYQYEHYIGDIEVAHKSR